MSHIDTAQQHKHGKDSNGDAGEIDIHQEEIAESACEHRQHRDGVRQGLRQEIHHRVHILLQTVDDIATMEARLRTPLRAQQSVEHQELHSVTGSYT